MLEVIRDTYDKRNMEPGVIGPALASRHAGTVIAEPSRQPYGLMAECTDDQGGRMFVCSDTDYCRSRLEAKEAAE